MLSLFCKVDSVGDIRIKAGGRGGSVPRLVAMYAALCVRLGVTPLCHNTKKVSRDVERCIPSESINQKIINCYGIGPVSVQYYCTQTSRTFFEGQVGDAQQINQSN